MDAVHEARSATRTIGLAAALALAADGARAQVEEGWRLANAGLGDFAGWATESGVVPLVGDFDNDGRDDVALLRQAPGWASIPVAFAAGGGGWSLANGPVGDFAAWAADATVRPLLGDFDRDGRHDVALLRLSPGWSTVPTALAAGSGDWRVHNAPVGDFAGWATQDGVLPLVGDYDADGTHDVALVRQTPGWTTIPVAFARGDGTWSIANGGVGDFAIWATEGGVRALPGDFDGDGRGDVALLRQRPGWGSVPVASADGAGGWTVANGAVGAFAGWATEAGVAPIVGDFDGDGRDDVGLLRRGPGWSTLPVAFSGGSGGWTVTNGGLGPFADWAAEDGVEPLVGDFDADGRDDVALLRRTAGWGTMPVAFSAGGGEWTIANHPIGPFASWATEPGVEAFVGDFDDDPGDDVALLRLDPGWASMPAALAAPKRLPVSIERETDRPGSDYVSFDLPRADPALCQGACAGDGQCRAYTYVRPGLQGPTARCWLKSAVPAANSNACCTSGTSGR